MGRQRRRRTGLAYVGDDRRGQLLFVAPRRRRICARCGFPAHLAGPLVVAASDATSIRYLCRCGDCCARRRREREAQDAA